MRVCPDCHAVVRETANYCDNCGHAFAAAGAGLPATPLEAVQQSVSKALPGTCSSCGYLNVLGEMFCQNCGVQLAPVASTPPPAPTPVSQAVGSAAQAKALDRCPTCGFRTNSEDAFCQNCGAPISSSAAAIQSEASAPLTEPATVEELSKLAIKLVVQTSNEAILLDLERDEWLVGRSDPVRGIFPEVDLVSHGGEKCGVSRRHARLIAQGGQRFISDLNSTNFTFLNGEKLQSGRLYPLKHGDEIRFGLLTLEYFEEIAE
jgi:predicted amidophosphoribosyltransferase